VNGVAAFVLLLLASVVCAAPSGSTPRRLVVFLGDSLTAGWGLEAREAYPALLGAELAAAGVGVDVLNAGVSGDTAAQGLARLDGVLARRPALVVVALGTNDALRGLPPAALEATLGQIVTRCRSTGAAVLLIGMRFGTWLAPPDAGRYEAVCPRLAARLAVPLLPDLMVGVSGDPTLCFPDRLHPNAAGQRRVAGTVSPALLSLLGGAGRV
jgi:acyl-CoA thioesterase I